VTSIKFGNKIGMHKNEIETPVLMVDLDTMESNLKKMAEFFKTVPANLRPHTKTHKTPSLAHKQIEYGAVGICCGTLDEAAVMISAGIRDVLVTREIVSPEQLDRVIGLSRHSDIIIIVDDHEVVERFALAAESNGVKVRTMIDVRCRLDRSGVLPGDPSLLIARKIHNSKGLKFAGIAGYEGSMHGWKPERREASCKEALSSLIETKELIERDGIEVPIVSAGATSTYRTAGSFPGITEVQAGTYITMDDEYYGFFPEFNIALSVLTTVISRPSSTVVTTDAGSKKLTTDEGLPVPKDSPWLKLKAVNEEHGVLELMELERKIVVGDKIEIIPSHGCTTFNLYDHVYGMRDDHLEIIWKIAARGC